MVLRISLFFVGVVLIAGWFAVIKRQSVLLAEVEIAQAKCDTTRELLRERFVQMPSSNVARASQVDSLMRLVDRNSPPGYRSPAIYGR